MWPSAQAVVEMTELLGYSCVVVPPRFNDWTGAADYERGRRRVFVGAKHTPLDSIENEELRRLSTLEQEESVGTGDLHHLHEQLSASRAENAALRAQITSLT
jgi:hypothetical protein